HGRGRGSALTTPDLPRTAMLRRPQGTLYGRNTTGGALNTLSQDPGDRMEGWVAGRIGSYNEHEISGALNVPVDDTLSIRGAFQHSQNDGYFRSNFTNEKLLDNNTDVARLKIRWQPSDNLTFLLSGDYSKITG